MISDDFRCFSMFSAVFGCFPTVFRLFSDHVFRLLKSSSSWSKLSMIGPQLFSGWYQMILDVFQCSQLFSDVFRLFSDDVFRLLKSSSNWTKSSMMGPQLFLGWYQMILDVFRCSQLLSLSGDLGIGLVWDNRTTGPTKKRNKEIKPLKSSLQRLNAGTKGII